MLPTHFRFPHPISSSLALPLGRAAARHARRGRLGAAALTILTLLTSAALRAALPPGVTLPFTVIDCNFNDQTVGRSPRPLTKAQIEARGPDPWQRPPLSTYDYLEFVTPERTATVVKAALGLTDQPVLFTLPDNNQPDWGPRMTFEVPQAIAGSGQRWRVSFDTAINNLTQMGGMYVLATNGRVVFDVGFFQGGSFKANAATEVGTYQAGVSLHVDILADTASNTFTVTLNHNAANAAVLPWSRADGSNLGALVFNGLLPGGRAWPGQVAYDNIKLVLEAAL